MPSSPYFLYGAERRYPFAWHGGAGGVPWSRVAAESRGLGIFDMLESGLDPSTKGFPAFRNTGLHDPSNADLGDWPLWRPAGPEPLDPHHLAGMLDGLSDNEKLAAAVAGAGIVAWWLMRGRGKRRNPMRNPARRDGRWTKSRRKRRR